VELAAFYSRHGLERDLDRLLADLYEAKGAGYAGGDLDSIARFHTVLGIVLSEEGRYASSGYDNAEFQLRRALEVERRLAARDGRPPRPLPHLERRYGDVLQAIDKKKDAAAAYERAALGYLTLDDLPSADRSVRLAMDAGARDETVRAIRTVVADRNRLAEGRLDPAAVLEGRAASWVLGDVELALPPDTLDHQRFRLLADLAESGRAGDETRAALLGVEARVAAQKLEKAPTVTDAQRLRRLDAAYDIDLRYAGESMEKLDTRKLKRLLDEDGGRVDG
jgi:hypothetical protein